MLELTLFENEVSLHQVLSFFSFALFLDLKGRLEEGNMVNLCSFFVSIYLK